MSVDLHSFSLKAKFRHNIIKVFKYIDLTAAIEMSSISYNKGRMFLFRVDLSHCTSQSFAFLKYIFKFFQNSSVSAFAH